MHGYHVPIEFAGNNPYTPPAGAIDTIIIAGAASDVARVLAPRLVRDFRLFGFDTRRVDSPYFDQVVHADIHHRTAVQRLFSQAGTHVVLNATTGVAGGWDGLVSTEIEGTKALSEMAVEHNTARLVHCSSLHTVGWNERMWLADGQHRRVSAGDYPRADGAYGAAKVFAETLLRYVSDSVGMPVSVLRIGTFRAGMDKDELIASDQLPYLGRGGARAERLGRTWLRHGDLERAVRTEVARTERFCLRALTSDPDQYDYDHAPLLDG